MTAPGDSGTPLAGSAGSDLSCFDCAWHRSAGYWAHVVCRYPRERVPKVVDLSKILGWVAVTHYSAATVCPAFLSPNAQRERPAGMEDQK